MQMSKALAAAVAFCGIGCAFQEATVRQPDSASVTSGYRIYGSPAVILVTPFLDERPDRSRCGMKKAGGKAAAGVYCREAPAQ